MTLTQLGFDAQRWADDVAAARVRFGEVVVGRVAADFGVEHRVIGEFGDERAVVSGKLRFEVGTRPAVGDWVVMQRDHGALVIVDILPRRSELLRQAAGTKTDVQVIATNIDVVFVVTSFNEDFNINRIERYLAAIIDGGATPVVLVNKADLFEADAREALLEDLQQRLHGTPVVALSALDGSVATLTPWLKPASTASFVGSSGVGKSTIVNALLGEQRQATFDVRESDARGRHTTTHREMFQLASGAIVLDTPGMREFQLHDEVATLDAFLDVAEAAQQCRFRDCAHESEPGCAVAAAVEDGTLTAARIESWKKLQQEGRERAQRNAEAARRKKTREGTSAKDKKR